MSWDFKGASVCIAGVPHSLTARRGTMKRCKRVVLQEDVEIPPRSQVNVPCKVVLQQRPPAYDMEEKWATQPTTIHTGVHVARTLTPPGQFTDVPVRVMNVSEEPHLLPAGTVVSDLEQLEEVSRSLSLTPTFAAATPDSNRRYPPLKVDRTPEYIEKLIDGVDDAAPESATITLRQLLKSYRHVFSESECDLGHTDIVTHRIDTGNARPFRQQLRRFPPAQLEAISEHLENMLQQGVIEPAASPWASNIVLVKKKDQTYRCCIDYRQLNSATVKDAYPLPRIDSCLDAMSQARWFSTFDLRSSYHQVSVDEQDRDKTAFTCPRACFGSSPCPSASATQGLRSSG